MARTEAAPDKKTMTQHIYEKASFILAGIFVLGAAWLIYQLLGLMIIILVIISFIILAIVKGGFILLLK